MPLSLQEGMAKAEAGDLLSCGRSCASSCTSSCASWEHAAVPLQSWHVLPRRGEISIKNVMHQKELINLLPTN